MIGPYIDTLLICTLTGLVIVTIGVWKDKKLDVIQFVPKSEITIMEEDGSIHRNGVIKDEDLFSGSFTVTHGVAEEVIFSKNSSTVDEPYIYCGDVPFNGTALVAEDGAVFFTNDHGEVVPGGEIELHGKILQNGSPLTAWAFKRGLSPITNGGNYIVTIAVFLFAISTAISWSYYGDRSIDMHFLGAVFSLEVVWGFGDTALGLMTIPNLIAIFALSGVTRRLTVDYFTRPHKRFKTSLFDKRQ